jgi:hypothetical protein
LILPTKRLPEDRALLAVGADVLSSLARPQTVSKLWDEMKRRRSLRKGVAPLTFDWFVLSLSFLFAINAVELHQGRLRKVKKT